MADENSAQGASLLEHLLQHARVGMALARRGIEQARQRNERDVVELFESALSHYSECAAGARQHMHPAHGPGATSAGEQVTSASFAPGDGASDADVVPDDRRDRAGNWPAY